MKPKKNRFSASTTVQFQFSISCLTERWVYPTLVETGFENALTLKIPTFFGWGAQHVGKYSRSTSSFCAEILHLQVLFCIAFGIVYFFIRYI